MAVTCPNCGSDNTRRGGNAVWTIYMLLLLIAVPAVIVFHLHAGLVAAILLVAIVITHLVFDQRVCIDCGTQWKK